MSSIPNFGPYVENQFDTKIKILRTDGGGKYTSTVFNHFYSSNGIIHQLTFPHTPQQNNTTERKHKHLIECSLTMLFHSNLHLFYQSYVISVATHIINRFPTPVLLYQSPWKLLHKSKPDLSHLKTFGCTCFPLPKPYNSYKLQPHTKSCVFLGYPAYSKGYICLEPTPLGFISLGMSCSINLNFCPYNLLLYPPIHLLTLLLYLQLLTSWLFFIICHNLPSHHLVLPLPPHLLFLLFLVLSHQLLMHASPIPKLTPPNHTSPISPHAGSTPKPTPPNHTLHISPIDQPLSPSTQSTHLVPTSSNSLQP